jgi:F0F1-type ATP synthase assembly protein I
LNNGFGDALSNAFELAVTPAIFGVLGYFIDRALGLVPLFTLVFSLFVIGYMFWKFWRKYEVDMTRHEEALRTGHRGSGQ